MPDMINPQKGIDLMNNKSIINRILFAVTIFQHSPLTRRVFYNIIRREREGKQHQLGNINNIIHWITSSTGKQHHMDNIINWITGGINIIHLVIWHHDH
jgi:hypothetical protein